MPHPTNSRSDSAESNGLTNTRRASVESNGSRNTKRASVESNHPTNSLSSSLDSTYHSTYSTLSRLSSVVPSTSISSSESQRTQSNNGDPSKASHPEDPEREMSTSHLSNAEPEPSDSFHSIETQKWSQEEEEVAVEIVHHRDSDIPYHSPRLIESRRQRLQFLLRSSFMGFLVMLMTHFEVGVIRML